MQSDHRDAGLSLELLALREVIFQEGFEIVTTATEKCLQGEGEKSLEVEQTPKAQGLIQPLLLKVSGQSTMCPRTNALEWEEH